LEQIAKPPYTDWMKGLQIRSNLSNKFGAAVKNGSIAQIYMGKMFKSKEYRFIDMFKFMAGFTLFLKNLWPEIMKTNLYEEVTSLKVPAYFFLGRYDYQASSILADKYIKGLKADVKKIVWFEESAHLCHIEEQEKFGLEMQKVLLS